MVALRRSRSFRATDPNAAKAVPAVKAALAISAISPSVSIPMSLQARSDGSIKACLSSEALGVQLSDTLPDKSGVRASSLPLRFCFTLE